MDKQQLLTFLGYAIGLLASVGGGGALARALYEAWQKRREGAAAHLSQAAEIDFKRASLGVEQADKLMAHLLNTVAHLDKRQRDCEDAKDEQDKVIEKLEQELREVRKILSV